MTSESPYLFHYPFSFVSCAHCNTVMKYSHFYTTLKPCFISVFVSLKGRQTFHRFDKFNSKYNPVGRFCDLYSCMHS